MLHQIKCHPNRMAFLFGDALRARTHSRVQIMQIQSCDLLVLQNKFKREYGFEKLLRRFRVGSLAGRSKFPYGSPLDNDTTIVVLFLFLVLVDPCAHQTQRTCKASKSIFLICLICKTDRSALWVRIPRPKIEELALQAQGEGIFSFAEIPVRVLQTPTLTGLAYKFSDNKI